MELCVSECGLTLEPIFFALKVCKYRIECLTPQTVAGALKVISEAFCNDEYVCNGTEVNKNPEAAEELLELCADAALDGVSVVAIEIASGDVVATSINKIQVSDPSITEKPFFEVFAEERCKQESSKALINFMADFDSRCNLFEIYATDCSLELMFLATMPEHRQKKLAFLCCKASLELGKMLKNGPVAKITVKDLGPKYSHMQSRAVTEKVPTICQAIATSIPTQKIGKSLNFTVHLRLPFTEYEFNGKKYNERVGYDPFCECIAIKLD